MRFHFAFTQTYYKDIKFARSYRFDPCQKKKHSKDKKINAGSIQSVVKPMTYKLLLTASLLDVRYYWNQSWAMSISQTVSQIPAISQIAQLRNFNSGLSKFFYDLRNLRCALNFFCFLRNLCCVLS